MARTRFLCDTCKYDYDGACTRPERPNAVRCPDYAPAGRTAAADGPRPASGLGAARRVPAALFRAVGKLIRNLRPSRARRPSEASKAVDDLFDELDISVKPEPEEETRRDRRR